MKILFVTHPYPKVRVPQKFKEALVENFKRGDRRQYEYLKDILTFPEFWPGIRWFEIVEGQIVVATHLEEAGGFKHLILDADGRLVQERFLPLIEVDGEGHHYPSALTNGILYQVAEDKETDTWYLQVTEFEPI